MARHLDRFDDVEAWLRDRLRGPLPGLPAQAIMAPRPRRGWKPPFVPDTARPAAAIVLLYPLDGHPALVLTVRTSTLPDHAGQVSLPGGRVDEGETVEDAAVREAFEEVGVEPAHVETLGRLTSLHIPVSGFILYPVVAITRSRPPLVASEAEVARVLEVPLAALADPARVRVDLRPRLEGDFLQAVPSFLIDGEHVWGATAMVLSEFLTLLGVPPLLPTGRAEYDRPLPCPACGGTVRLFTPNAARRFSAEGAADYEAAWQCTTCGTIEFIATPAVDDTTTDTADTT